MTDNEFDEQLKIAAFMLAGMEQLETIGKIDSARVFMRAKDLYHYACEKDIHNWKNIWEDKKAKKVKIKEPVEVKTVEVVDKPEKEEPVSESMKKCQNCGEMVSMLWKKHVYRSDGTLCGYKFEELA